MFNKNFVTLFMLTVIVTCACYTNQTEAKLVETGLVSYWSLNEIKDQTVTDDWGDNHGTIEGAETAIGKYGNALHFDGQDDYVNCGNEASLDLTDAISIEAWVYMESVGTYPTVVAKSGANWGYIFEFLTTTGKINLYLDKANPSWANVADTGIQLKEWTHLAATYDGKTIHYYFNGELDGTYSNIPGGQIASNADNVHIGGRKVGEPHNFNGIIDEVRLYNRALSEAEVNQNLNSDGTAVNLGGKVATTWGHLKSSR